MSLKKEMIIIISIVFITTIVLGAAAAQVENVTGESPVDELYQDIRNAPLPIGVEERVVHFYNEGHKIVCTLAVPKTRKKGPVVITLPGFIGMRDEEPIPGTDDTVFGRMSKVLAGYGIASLRMDYRGYGDSDGNFAIDCNFSTQVRDVLACLDFIRKNLRDEVDHKSIGILGFSQGGLVGTTAAAADGRVESLVLWSPAVNLPFVYGQLLTVEGIKKGWALQEGEVVSVPIWADGIYYGDIDLGYQFFKDLFRYDPLAEIKKFEGHMMVVSGLKDTVVWPQPAEGLLFLKYHDGPEKIVIIDADHEFNYQDGPDVPHLDDAIFWSAAWMIHTLD